ncbi:unnamed protein product [Schistosoma margrebowiei]|uniref:Uncharacterized protein n=1 Tax=Schistosoma margrebowiei TaxID=48269 RepID=A0A183M7A7_9TREM|nr:unnamed protein product [Schistosoma margrebowiei]
MKNSTSKGRHRIQWTDRNQLEDLDFADDLTLLSHTHESIQMKTTRVAVASSAVGLNIHRAKDKILKYDMENTNPITLDEEAL